MHITRIINTIILILGVIIIVFMVKETTDSLQLSNGYITVKGIAERTVKADLGIWKIDYKEVGNDLPVLVSKITQDQKAVQAFLLSHGFTLAEITIQSTKVHDLFADPYRQNTQGQVNRYILSGGVHLRTMQVDRVFQISQLTSELIKIGIPLSLEGAAFLPNQNPSYFYTQLDTIRPDMMAQATRSARAIALQFAKDSGSQLGSIRRASQGVFQLTSRDSDMAETSSIDKKVRLVTTIDFYLKK